MIHCYNCKNNDTQLVHSQNSVITYQNVLLATKEEAIAVPKGDIDLHFCNHCTFLFNASFDYNLVGYGIHYENAQNHSEVFEQHVNTLITHLIHNKKINQHHILEIGCGNGYFLKKLIAGAANKGVGFDTSLGLDEITPNVSLYSKYYDASDPGDFDVVLSRHVVEHILDNNELINLIVKKNKSASLYIETPSFEWIVKHNAFYDIFYEHCSYFSKKSLRILFERNNITVKNIDTVFGDQYLWLESGKPDTKQDLNILSLNIVIKFFQKMIEEQTYYKNIIQEEFAGKNIAIWGAGAKGVTFANFIDPSQKFIQCVFDINPKKCGKFLPGSAHPILQPNNVTLQEINTIIIMNPNYQQEIMNLINNKNIQFITVGNP